LTERDIDLKAAINAVSDVIQNRPRPIREFDQIYMKTGDMVMQSELVASWARDKRLAFIGDGDAISVCVAYLKTRGIIDYGPSRICVFDFDERIVQAIKRFADKERIEHLDAILYNCVDGLPELRGRFDSFYTNPPWGQYNDGASVNLFMRRGMEAIHFSGQGMVVIADDPELPWTKTVLANAQKFASSNGFFVSRMMTQLHSYHLDDAADLRSCNLMFSSVTNHARESSSLDITDPLQLENFYGRKQNLRVQYVRECKKVDYGKASEEEYTLEHRTTR
jgi:N4-bis(aminopropyl)spermidine synthase